MATNMWLVGWIIDLEISQQEVDFLQWKEFCNSTETNISAPYWNWLINDYVDGFRERTKKTEKSFSPIDCAINDKSMKDL